MNGEVPEVFWRGRNISYDNFRTIGCESYVHVPKQNHTKVDDNSRRCPFLNVVFNAHVMFVERMQEEKKREDYY